MPLSLFCSSRWVALHPCCSLMSVFLSQFCLLYFSQHHESLCSLLMSLSYLFCFLLLNTSSIALLVIHCMVCMNLSSFALFFSTRSIRCWLFSVPRVLFKIPSRSYFLCTGLRKLLSSLSTIFLFVLFQSPRALKPSISFFNFFPYTWYFDHFLPAFKFQ